MISLNTMRVGKTIAQRTPQPKKPVTSGFSFPVSDGASAHLPGYRNKRKLLKDAGGNRSHKKPDAHR